MEVNRSPVDDIELSDAYGRAWSEWQDTDDAHLWEQTTSDGFDTWTLATA
jgi:hypothetical protein